MSRNTIYSLPICHKKAISSGNLTLCQENKQKTLRFVKKAVLLAYNPITLQNVKLLISKY